MKNKKTNKKALLLSCLALLFAALLALTLVSCKKDGKEPTDDEASGGAHPITELLKGKLDTYQFVRSDKMKDEERNVLLSFAEVLRQNGNETVNLVSDYERMAPIIDNEVIIGGTTRKGTVYNEGEGIVVQTDTYTFEIIENRLIFTYAHRAGMTDGLEFLLFCLIDGEEAAIRDQYDIELFGRGIKRYSSSSFTLKNELNKKSVLSADAVVPFIGTASPNSTVTVQLAKESKVLDTFEAVADSDGTWKADVTPNTDADTFYIRVDGKLAYGSSVSFTKNETKNCADGTKVYIDGKQVNVHSNDAGNHVIASLVDASKTSMEVKIVRSKAVSDCIVRPLSAGIEPTVSGKTVTFTVTKFPAKLSVEFDDFDQNANPLASIQLFLYDHEVFEPNLKDRDLMYFAPGEYWIDDMITLSSNTTVYLAEGALLHARFDVNNANNVIIEGRGIIDTYYFKEEETNMMTFEACRNLTLRDYMLTGPRKWMTKLVNVDNCLVDALNIAGTKVNSDGVDIVASTNVTVQNCYIKSNDDCIAIKSFDNNVENVTVKNCVMWNLEYGNAIEIGYETKCESMTDITFENNDIIHIKKGACLSIHLGGFASISNVKYKDIRIEEAYLKTKLIDIFIKDDQKYNKVPTRGHISDVTFENIRIYDDEELTILVQGYDKDHVVNNVNIGKIWQDGGYISSKRITFTTNEFVTNLKYDNTLI